jgi:DNA-binding MarR family transcriptional regulator
MTQRELTTLMSSDPNTIASLLERMEKGHLIERRVHERDRRAYRLRALSRGKRVYGEAREIAIALQQEVLAVLPVERREGFLADLALVADVCKTVAGNPARNKTKT